MNRSTTTTTTTMSRPKSAGGGTRSFLEDLLGTNDEQQLPRPSASSSSASSAAAAAAAARQRKSVRFFDEPNSTESSSRPRSARPAAHSSALDSLLDSVPSKSSSSSSASSSAATASANRSSQSDWLGIGANDDDDDDRRRDLIIKKPTTPTTPPETNDPIRMAKITTETPSSSLSLSSIRRPVSSPSPMVLASGIATNNEQDDDGGLDWISSGLKARQSRHQNVVVDSTKKPQFLQSNQQQQDEPLNASQDHNHQGSTRAGQTAGNRWQPKLLSSDQGDDAPGSTVLNDQRRMAGTVDPETAGHTTGGSDPSTEPSSTGAAAQHQHQQQPNQAFNPDVINFHHQQQKLSSIEQEMLLQQQQQLLLALEDSAPHSSISSSSSSSIIVLQTKLRILTLEKSFLEQTVAQMKQNHQDELNAMISLYEQQMRLTTEMYKRHEDMVQEERDRRILELKSQLEKSERDLEEMRTKYKQRLAVIEEEYQRESKRLQETYDTTIKQMIEEHEQELKRLEQRLKAEAESDIQTSADLVKHQYRTVTELMAKWEESAFKIERLQRSLMAKQEEAIREQMLNSNSNFNNKDDGGLWNDKIKDLEERWKSFLVDMQKQRMELEHSIKNEYEQFYAKEETKIREMQLQLQKEREEIGEMKQRFANEVREWREKETVEAQKLLQEREKLKEDVVLFEERRSLLETLYNERKRMLDDEQQRIQAQSAELIRKQQELNEKEAKIKQSWSELETLKQQLQADKIRFNQEKEQMTRLGQTLAARAEELEKLSQMALKEKMDSIQAMDEIERIRSQIQKDAADLENTRIKIEMEKQRLVLEQNQLDQQLKILKELKESIVCTLCGTTLNPAGNPGNPSPLSLVNGSSKVTDSGAGGLFYSLINGGYIMRQQSYRATNGNNNGSWPGSQDGDQTLLFCQMAAQQDAASLAEETRFLKIIMNNNNQPKI